MYRMVFMSFVVSCFATLGICPLGAESANVVLDAEVKNFAEQNDPCQSNPCLNDGACIPVENSYGCICDEPFFGEHCENDPCTSNPCENGFSCRVAGIDFNCSCEPPYSGKQCEQIECDCGNGRECKFENGIKTCSCAHYERVHDGKCKYCYCGKYADDCQIFESGNRQCLCHEGYASKNNICEECYCGVDTESCSYDFYGIKVCKCKNKLVQRNETCAAPCDSHSDCLNGGRCVRESNTSGNRFFCRCEGDFAGDRCEIDVCAPMKETCDSMRAVCRRKGEAGLCECTGDATYSYETGTCEICTPNTCLNEGRCDIVGDNSFKCTCHHGSHGRRCELRSGSSINTGYWTITLFFSIAIILFS